MAEPEVDGRLGEGTDVRVSPEPVSPEASGGASAEAGARPRSSTRGAIDYRIDRPSKVNEAIADGTTTYEQVEADLLGSKADIAQTVDPAGFFASSSSEGGVYTSAESFETAERPRPAAQSSQSGAVDVGPQTRAKLTLDYIDSDDADPPDIYDEDFEDPTCSPSASNISPISKISPATQGFEEELKMYGYSVTVDSADASMDDVSQGEEEEDVDDDEEEDEEEEEITFLSS